MAPKTPPAESALDGVPLEDFVQRRVQHLLANLSGGKVEGLYPVIMREVERSLIRTALVHTGGRREEAARILGMHRNTLRLRIQALGLDKAEKAKRS